MWDSRCSFPQTRYWFYTAVEHVDPWSDWELDPAYMRDVYPGGHAYSIFFSYQNYQVYLGANFDPPYTDFNFD